MPLSKRCVVSVATDSWIPMQERLIRGISLLGEETIRWSNSLPRGCPPHRTSGVMSASRDHDCRPYSFKSYAMKEAASQGYTSLLWCDSCIIPLRSLAPIWEAAERDGVWICRNGFNNYQWTADSAYEDLFRYDDLYGGIFTTDDPNVALRELNKSIEHVVATVFAISTAHDVGAAFLDEYFRLASETRAFCGPWQNSNAPRVPNRNNKRPSGPCGPPSVLGHRHDQSAASVIAWRLGVKLHDPVWFSYAETPETILLAKGEI